MSASGVAGRWMARVDAIASCAMILASIAILFVIFTRPTERTAAHPTQPAPIPSAPVSLEGAAVRGDPKARLVIIEYSEFQCPYCASFARETLPTLLRDYVDSGKVRLAFRHLPLEQIHPLAMKAAEAGECARRQGKFWAMHDYLFNRSGPLEPNRLDGAARAVGMEDTLLSTCLQAGDAAGHVREDLAIARTLRVTGTPTFFFGLALTDGRVLVRRRLSGAPPLSAFVAALSAMPFGNSD